MGEKAVDERKLERRRYIRVHRHGDVTFYIVSSIGSLLVTSLESRYLEVSNRPNVILLTSTIKQTRSLSSSPPSFSPYPILPASG
jgi:hypothetical protein